MLLHYFLILVMVSLPITMLTCYAIAVKLGHVPAEFPYISDTGTTVPESCIFSLMLNSTAFLFGAVVYLRFLQVKEYIRLCSIERLQMFNYIALFIGFVSSYGVAVVACFQETSVLVVHFAAAFVAFFGTGCYMALETYISFRTSPMSVPKWIAVTRGVVAILYLLSFIISTVTGPIASEHYTGHNERKWYPTDGGWNLHLTSAITEWMMGFFLVLFLATYGNEWHHSKISAPKIEVSVQPIPQMIIGRNPFDDDDDDDID